LRRVWRHNNAGTDAPEALQSGISGNPSSMAVRAFDPQERAAGAFLRRRRRMDCVFGQSGPCEHSSAGLIA